MKVIVFLMCLLLYVRTTRQLDPDSLSGKKRSQRVAQRYNETTTNTNSRERIETNICHNKLPFLKFQFVTIYI